MFEQATRLRLRFDTVKGSVSTEDLWTLSLANLDKVAVELHKQLRESNEAVSFVTPVSKKDNELQLKFDIAKHIIDVRVAERDAARVAAERSVKKQQLLEVLSRKQNAELENKTTEELTNMINAL